MYCTTLETHWYHVWLTIGTECTGQCLRIRPYIREGGSLRKCNGESGVEKTRGMGEGGRGLG